MLLKEMLADKGYNIHVSKSGIVYKNDVPVSDVGMKQTKPMCLSTTTMKQLKTKVVDELRKAKGDEHPVFKLDGYFKYVPKAERK